MTALASDVTATKPHYIHATALMVGEAGLLLMGPSRSGKSSLALALLAAATRGGRHACLIGDDRVSIEPRGPDIILRGHPAISGKIEQRGRGILDVPWVPYGYARYAFDLIPQASTGTFTEITTCIEGVTLPLFRLPFVQTVEGRAEWLLSLVQKATP
jgi:hypothetical protein